ncbi:MAG: GntR family transcriptional regulator [Paracoccus sp. (in: a-proteobacteria)]|uniref:GntR family transcriptional regulator n=1 Tax=Paracoccus sp. TaxID=267 RepID=UPI0026E039E9|nr:GntR family transcriptional regulator [Paracoccus sp. (in: a-proteobacteria)]MDO5612527.1 GntR family transcriptional regulator [Paracoccus sp. (in: a-proteobacteria)]
MKTGPKRRPLRSAVLHDALRQMIVTAVLPPGAPLNERDLCAQFGVSRTPLREAILRLAEHGLVEVAPQHGTFVSHISPRAVRLGHFLRENLELPVIRRLASDAMPDLTAARAAVLEQKLAETRNDHAAFILADDAFHQALFEAACLPEIWEVIHAKKAHLDRSRFQSGMLRGGLARPIAQHEAILQAIGDRLPDRAVALAREHIDSGLIALDYLTDEAAR